MDGPAAHVRSAAVCRVRRCAAAWIALTIALLATTAGAQTRSVQITGDRLGGFVLPIEPLAGDIDISARRAWAWTVDDTKRLVLEDDVVIIVGAYRLASPRAVVWINRLPSADGLINQFAIYFDEVGDPIARAGLGVSGRDLLVTGSARGQVRARAVLMEQRPPPADVPLQQAEARLAEHLKLLLARQPRLSTRPQIERSVPPDEFRPVPGGQVTPEDLDLPTELALPAPGESAPWLSDPSATIRFSFPGTFEGPQGESEFAYLVTGGVLVEYVARRTQTRFGRLTLSAERAVIFTDPVPLSDLAGSQLGLDVVRGVYLEGNVIASADEGTYVVRAPRIYYDFRRGQAIMLDAVLRTYSRSLRGPIYARAGEMRQIAANQWDAERVDVSTSEFFTPHLSIGAERMTITQRPAAHDEDALTETHVDSHHNTLRLGGTPVLYWPRLAGRVQDAALQAISIGTADNDGVKIETTWNLVTLLGKENLDGIDAQLRLDGYTERGGGVGIKLDYDLDFGAGTVDLYGLYDEGTDRTSSGREVDPAHDFRGVALLEHQTDLGRNWLLQAQAAYISDETFMTSWREEDFLTHLEYETSAYLKHQQEKKAFTLLVKDQVTDFISNDYLLASRQYSVDRLPELSFRRYGSSWFDDTVTYSAETRLSQLAMAFDERSPNQHGVRNLGMGFLPNEKIADTLRARGLSSQHITRLDSRHELSRPSKIGIFRVTPFAVSRLTAWDEDYFDDFSADSDDVRLFGALGMRISTQVNHVDNSVESRSLDLHRLRHIIEPSVTLWYGHSTVSNDDLPEYDPEVEGIDSGTVARFGLLNTWQTQRGGPGMWRSVDFLTLDTEVVVNSDDANTESPTPQYFDYRPEYSQFGDHVRTSLIWKVSDTLSIAGEATYDTDDDIVARSSIGAEMSHSPLLSTFIEYRKIDVDENELLDILWEYQITKKYGLRLGPQWDFQENDFRAFRATVVRRFPDFNFIVQVKYDDIRNDTTVSASLGLAEF